MVIHSLKLLYVSENPSKKIIKKNVYAVKSTLIWQNNFIWENEVIKNWSSWYIIIWQLLYLVKSGSCSFAYTSKIFITRQFVKSLVGIDLSALKKLKNVKSFQTNDRQMDTFTDTWSHRYSILFDKKKLTSAFNSEWNNKKNCPQKLYIQE